MPALLGSAFFIGSEPSIFSKAEINPCGLRVNSTEEASARYSRFRDNAIWAKLAQIGPRINTNTIATILKMITIVPPLSLSLSRSSSIHQI